MKSLKSLWAWAKAKFGRIVSAAGFLLSASESLDISPIKDPLEGIIGHKGVLWLTVALFALSWLRHQYVASLHPKTDPLPAPAPEATR